MTKRIEFFRHTLGGEEHETIGRTIDSLFLTLGPRVAEFEGALSAYLGGGVEAVGVSSCTVGMFLTMKAFDVGSGDEVITTPMTFAATSNAILHAGATPVFVDIDEATGLIDPKRVEAAVTPRTKAIIAVHLYGQMADMRSLCDIAKKAKLFLFEDAAHGIEMEREGQRPAQASDAAIFSFYATKTMTSGDGGAIAVRDPSRANRLRRLRNHGMSKDASARHGAAYQHWDMMELGYKGAMTDIEASLLLPQLSRVDEQRAAREERVSRYVERFANIEGVETLTTTGTSSHHLFPVLVSETERDNVLAGLGQRNIGCAVNYRAVHTLRYYRDKFGDLEVSLPVATRFGCRTLSLPLWPALPLEDVDLVVDALEDILRNA